MPRNLPRRRSNSTKLLSRRPGSRYHRSSGDAVVAAGIRPADIASSVVSRSGAGPGLVCGYVLEEGLAGSIDLGGDRMPGERLSAARGVSMARGLLTG